jgi:internalin A
MRNLSRSLPPRRDQAFVSYSHDDENYMLKLQKMLVPYAMNQAVKIWDDTKSPPGAVWRHEIQRALAAARVAVLLVSPGYLASSFIAEVELKTLLDAAQQDGLTILAVPVRMSGFKETVLERYQWVGSPDKPWSEMSDAELDRALVKVCEEIKTALQS